MAIVDAFRLMIFDTFREVVLSQRLDCISYMQDTVLDLLEACLLLGEAYSLSF